jgi:uncharacterized protein (DUF433 family)
MSQIIDRGRGPEIEGTRVTIYRIMDFVVEGANADRIAAELNLSMEEVNVALDYLRENRGAIETEYDRILQRVQQRNTAQVESNRAESMDDLKRRVRQRLTERVTHADHGRQWRYGGNVGTRTNS